MVFLDASAIICLLEGDAHAVRAVQDALAALRTGDRAPPIAASALSRLECRIGPLRARDDTLLERYEAFFADPGLTVIALDDAVIDRAAELRAGHGLRTPDALQAASLLTRDERGVFVTGDGGFRRVPGLQVHSIKV